MWSFLECGAFGCCQGPGHGRGRCRPGVSVYGYIDLRRYPPGRRWLIECPVLGRSHSVNRGFSVAGGAKRSMVTSSSIFRCAGNQGFSRPPPSVPSPGDGTDPRSRRLGTPLPSMVRETGRIAGRVGPRPLDAPRSVAAFRPAVPEAKQPAVRSFGRGWRCDRAVIVGAHSPIRRLRPADPDPSASPLLELISAKSTAHWIQSLTQSNSCWQLYAMTARSRGVGAWSGCRVIGGCLPSTFLETVAYLTVDGDVALPPCPGLSARQATVCNICSEKGKISLPVG